MHIVLSTTDKSITCRPTQVSQSIDNQLVNKSVDGTPSQLIYAHRLTPGDYFQP